MTLTLRQESLYNNQEVEPIFTYINTKTGKRNFGLVRLGSCSLDITLSLRSLFERGNILLGEPLEVELLCGTFEGNVCKLVKEN